jgi:hypothetical protein
MTSDGHRPGSGPFSGARRGVNAREAGLDTLARANRWMVAGAVALAGGASAVTWHAFQAHAAGLPRASNPVRPPARVHPVHHRSDDGGDEAAAPAAPAGAPAPAPSSASAPAPAAPAPAVSGGS